jgi:hypothetical protein
LGCNDEEWWWVHESFMKVGGRKSALSEIWMATNAALNIFVLYFFLLSFFWFVGIYGRAAIKQSTIYYLMYMFKQVGATTFQWFSAKYFNATQRYWAFDSTFYLSFLLTSFWEKKMHKPLRVLLYMLLLEKKTKKKKISWINCDHLIKR